ncbi:hypothetical protein CRI94_09705 [Longibacter salinarum]|uniref:histidine kinase n=1 Tax=Longibacter salinarum TaxID=1850348 RepID=A0A2A8CY03_9BACT|nr:ATP-binding protein [Longibacter salinarum]PEN13575.1 hypothetical protein CRI94_09705 [Longibacter salinarum]
MPHRFTRKAALLVAYGALFFLFDTFATQFEVAPGVSIWYPSAGLNLGLLIILGARFAPVVFLMSFLSGLWVAEPAIPAFHLVLPNLFIALANAGAAWWLRKSFSPDHPVSLKLGGRFMLVALGLPLVVSIGAVSAYAVTGLEGYTLDTVFTAASSWWTGDSVGILTITPLWLLAGYAALGRPDLGDAGREQVRFFLRSVDGWASALVETTMVLGALVMAFFFTREGHFQFYVCFLPLLWIALRNGLPRALVAVLLINLGATVAIHARGTQDDLLEFQFFMIALALTGLLLGLLVSERRRAVYVLQRVTGQLDGRIQALPTVSLPEQNAPESSAGGGDGEMAHVYAADRWTNRPPSIDSDGEADDDGELLSSVDENGDSGSRPYIWGANDVLTSSSDVLRRSAENLVELNQMLVRSKQELSRSNEQKDKLLSLISHDLKNPLVGIRGLSELLATQNPPSSFERPLALIQRSAEQALDLLDNLLTWSRLQTGHFNPSLGVHSLRLLVDDAMSQLETQAERKNITIENRVGPAIAVFTDAFIVDIVLRNLGSNAIKFTDSGGRVRIAAETDEGQVTVSVSDTGMGIPESIRDHLFEMTSQSSRSGTEGESGTGLGLHICQELLVEQGEEIWVDSSPETGTSFYFTLTRAQRPS